MPLDHLGNVALANIKTREPSHFSRYTPRRRGEHAEFAESVCSSQGSQKLWRRVVVA
jgi:hypothetical protein